MTDSLPDFLAASRERFEIGDKLAAGEAEALASMGRLTRFIADKLRAHAAKLDVAREPTELASSAFLAKLIAEVVAEEIDLTPEAARVFAEGMK